MKKTAIIGTIILLLGVALTVAVLALSDWDINMLSTMPDYTEKEYLSQNTDGIVIREENTRCIIGRSADSDIHVLYYENEKESYTFDENGSLIISSTRSYKWYDYILNFRFFDKRLTVLIPDGYDGKVDIKTSNGGITAQDISFDELVAVTNNGSVKLDGVTADALNLTTNNGSVRLDGVTADALGLTSRNGSVRLDGVDAQRLALESHNGAISGTLSGSAEDYTISSKTGNGSNSLSGLKGSGSRTLSAVTHNGDIRIGFEG